MATSTFDTLATVRELEAAGLERATAEAIAANIARAAGEHVTRTDLDAALAKLETRLTWRMLAVGGAVVALIKLIPG